MNIHTHLGFAGLILGATLVLAGEARGLDTDPGADGLPKFVCDMIKPAAKQATCRAKVDACFQGEVKREMAANPKANISSMRLIDCEAQITGFTRD